MTVYYQTPSFVRPVKASMPNTPSISTTANLLPDWSEKRFIVLDPSNRWAAAIGLQMHHDQADNQTGVFFETCSTTREALLLAESSNSIGLIVFLKGLERDCLGMFRRLSSAPNQPRMLVIGTSGHAELMPVILEAGASGFLLEVENDIPIADWCRQLLQDLRR